MQQFLDIGTGIPAANNTHEVTQAARPEARVTYVDNDPIVLAHARALLTSIARPDHVHRRRPAGRRHDLVPGGRDAELQPAVAAMLIAVLHLIPDEDDPWRIVASFIDAVPSGKPPGAVPPGPRRGGRPVRHGGLPLQPARSGPDASAYRDELARFLDGLEIAGPGLVQMHQWRPRDRWLPAATGASAPARVRRFPGRPGTGPARPGTPTHRGHYVLVVAAGRHGGPVGLHVAGRVGQHQVACRTGPRQ